MSRSQLLLVVLVTLLPCACLMRTAPRVDVAINLSRLDAPDTVTDATGILHRVCFAHLNALASGDGTARWLDATWRWYAPGDTTTVVDSMVIPPGTVQRVWGAPDITADTPLRSEWQVGGPIPAIVQMEYRYMTDGGDAPASTSVTLRCG